MATTLRDKMAGLPAARRARIDAETDRLHDEYKTLQQLRKARDLTQAEIAKTLNIRQASLAQMEWRSDRMISTLRGYIEGMGGTLKLVVEFRDRAPLQIGGIGEFGDTKPLKDHTTWMRS